MKKNTKKKLRDIRNAVVMMCVMVAMMSTASYAWFTLTSSPTVTGMQMTATSTTGLKICTTQNGTFVDAVAIDTDDTTPLKLKPVSPYSSGFSEAIYQGNEVIGLKTTNVSDLTDYVAVYECYLKAEGSETVQVGIICGDATTQGGKNMAVTDNQAEMGGSVVRTKASSSGDAAAVAANAIRVGIKPDGGKMVIWEPNKGQKTDSTNKAKVNSMPTLTTHISSDVNGTIDIGAAANETNVSGSFFEVGNTAKKVTIYIWLEGYDNECVNEIQTNDIEAQIQFTVVKDSVLSTL